jgi:putative copper resistance protein D
MMLEAGLVGARFAHFAYAIILFGSALFGLYSHPYGSLSMCLARRRRPSFPRSLWAHS